MAKSTDFPPNIREFGMAISRFSDRHYDYEIFSDFIDYMITCLLWDGDAAMVDRLKKKYGDDYQHFKELYLVYLQTMQRLLPFDSFDWHDILGEIYETISSSSKASALGQFFTPPSLCDVMASITKLNQQAPADGEKFKVNDCACGSGRTLLAFNKHTPGQLLYGEDLDQIATKMCAINLAIHGCKGQVCNMDSLNPNNWYFGFEINPRLYTMGGIPHIVRIEKEQSFTWSHWQLAAFKNETDPREKSKKQSVTIPAGQTADAGQQLTFF